MSHFFHEIQVFPHDLHADDWKTDPVRLKVFTCVSSRKSRLFDIMSSHSAAIRDSDTMMLRAPWNNSMANNAASNANNPNANMIADSTTFEGMIANSHQVLDIALSARHDTIAVNHIRSTSRIERAIPDILFRECQGILLLQVVEAALVFGASLGTGLFMSHDVDKNTWSAPSAVGLTGVTWGMLGGVARKDLVVFIMDKDTMNALKGDVSINLGGQAALTVGNRGREVDVTWRASNHGVGATIAFSYSRGLLVGLSLEGSVLASRSACNQRFYGRSVTCNQVLNEMKIPDSVKDLHAKLERLAEPNMKIREPIVYQPPQHTLSESFVVVPSLVDIPVMMPQSQTKREKEPVVMNCNVTTQTGDDEEVGTTAEPCFEKRVSIDTYAAMLRVAQTQTDEAEPKFVLCQDVQTQTGVDEVEVEMMEAPIKVTRSSQTLTHQVAQIQTDNDNMNTAICRNVQTQTGGVDLTEVKMSLSVEKVASWNELGSCSVATTLTDETESENIAIGRAAQTQTEKDAFADIMLEDEPLFEKWPTFMSETAQYQTVQTQTDDDEKEEDAVMVSDDEDFVLTELEDSDNDDDMEFVMSSAEIQTEMAFGL